MFESEFEREFLYGRAGPQAVPGGNRPLPPEPETRGDIK